MKTLEPNDVEPDGSEAGFALQDSLGFQIRHTHRLVQRYLQMQIEPHGISLGMWYFLRVLWIEDGLTQRELSHKVGTMEPTTLVAIKAMMANGLVKRQRNEEDGRKVNIFLTKKGKLLEQDVGSIAGEVNSLATRGISQADRKKLLALLAQIQGNIAESIAEGIDLLKDALPDKA